MSRRDNGLPATSYVRLRDVETHVVEGLLERLRDEDVAAYVAPAAGKRGPYGDTVLPGAPTDSVYVDVDRRDHARRVIEGYLAEVDEELAWAGIIADFDTPTADELPRWPASEDVDTDPFPGPSPARPDDTALPEDTVLPGDTVLPDDTGRRSSWRVVRPADPEAWHHGVAPGPATSGPATSGPATSGPATSGPPTSESQATGPVEDDHFEPPPPPPLPVPDTVGRFAWAAVLGGPLFLVVAALLDLDVSGWPGLLALVAFVAGFVTLVARMKDRPPTDLGDDDGAVV